jgi:hypothetical protein
MEAASPSIYGSEACKEEPDLRLAYGWSRSVDGVSGDEVLSV